MSAAGSCGCKLEENELEERLAAWREIATHATSSDVRPDRITSVYPSDPDVLARIKQLIAAEGHCCSFLEFTVTEIPVGTLVEMRWPPGARDLVDAFLQRVHRGLDRDRSPSHHV